MKIIDNVLEQEKFEVLKSKMGPGNFPWFHSETKSALPDTPDEEAPAENQQMYNYIYGFENMTNKQQSNTIGILGPLLYQLRPLALLRIKANLQFATKEIYKSELHTDAQNVPDDVKFYTCVYYMNTNNGYTFFEDTSIGLVGSVENRLLIFDGNTRHAGTTCTDARNRIVININFIPSQQTNLETIGQYENDK